MCETHSVSVCLRILFCSVNWGAVGSNSDNNCTASSKYAYLFVLRREGVQTISALYTCETEFLFSTKKNGKIAVVHCSPNFNCIVSSTMFLSEL